MDTQEIIREGEEVFLHTYNRYPLVIDHGEGAYLYDTDGRKYLDFCAGVAVSALGYGQPEYISAVEAQLEKVVHTSNYFYNEPAVEAAKKLCRLSGLQKVFFCNSGTEAVEGAIKSALCYASKRDGQTGHEIIAMEHSFHGRTMGALSATDSAAYQDPFRPMLPGFRFAKYNDLDSVKALVSDRTCAILLEPVQGEGGIYAAAPAFLQGIRALCDERDILMICDEVQCGLGRTGTMFAFEHSGVRPDILAVAKALGGGIPIGAFLTNEKAAALSPGQHGCTYGGSPLACAAANAVLDLYDSLHILEQVQRVGAYLYQKLDELTAGSGRILAHRGVGLMQGLEFTEPVAGIITQARENGLLLISAGARVLRFVPPLIITESQVDEMLSILTPLVR